LAALSGVASTQIDKTFVAGLLSMSELTYYAVPSGVLARLQSVPSAISHALMPVLSETRSRDGAHALADIYIRSARALFALSLPALGLLFVFMPQLLGLWLGPIFSEHAAAPARLLVIAQAFALAYHAPNALAGGLGGGRHASVTGWGQALMSLALWPFLIPRWGILGASVGAVVAQVIPTILYLDATHRTLIQLSWKKFSEEAVMPLIVPTAVLLIIAWVGRPWAWSWPGFLCVNALAGGAYAALTYRALPVDDRNAAARWLGFKGT
jgi:O-antigen/teichoic acid export membrane protein